MQSVAPTARRQTGNVSMLRGPRAGQSPETADWGTSGKDGGEICRLQLLPPQPNVPWETGLHTQQCCGRENKKWGGGRVGCGGGGGGGGHQPSTIFRSSRRRRVPRYLIHLISVGVPLNAPRCVQEHRAVVLFFVFLFFCRATFASLRHSSSSWSLNLGRLLLEGGSARRPRPSGHSFHPQ